MTREFIEFVLTHEDEDTARLLLSAGRYPHIDMPLAVQQIEGRRTAREKWPELLQCEEFLYPPRLNREQASSTFTAQHKASLASDLTRVADLTGGMGIDSLALARVAESVDYVERDPALCRLMEHNARALGIGNLRVHCADSLQWLAAQAGSYDLIYLDPARRSASGRKVAAFEECEPDLLTALPLLLSRCRRLMVKASPMIDIDLAVRQLCSVSDVYVVSLDGECKEVLFLCGSPQGEPQIHCSLLSSKSNRTSDTSNSSNSSDSSNSSNSSNSRTSSFTRSAEAAAEPRYCSAAGQYLYEPDAALMKAGPFRLLCQWYSLQKLAPNTHLYTADRLVEGFPGRIFHVLREVKPSRKAVAEVIPGGKAHVAVRNYPLSAADLQRQLGLREGGDLFLIATTVGQRRTAFICETISRLP